MSSIDIRRRFSAWRPELPAGRASLIAAVMVIVIVQLFSLSTLERIHPVWDDEGAYSDVAMQFVRHGDFAFPYLTGRGGLERSNVGFGRIWCVSLAVVYRVFGFGVLQGRLLAYACGLLSILLTYLICRRLKAPPATAAWAAALASIAYIAINSAHTIRPDAMLTTFIAFALYLYLVAEARDSWWLYAVAGLVAGLSADVHSNGASLPFAVAAVVIWRLGWRRAFTRVAPPFALGAGVGAIWWLALHVMPDPALFREQWSVWSPLAEPPLVALAKNPISWILSDVGRVLAPGLRSPGLVLTAGYWALFAVAVTAASVALVRRRRTDEREGTDGSVSDSLRDVLTPAVFVVALTIVLVLEAQQRAINYYSYTIPEISAAALLCLTVLERRWRVVVRVMAVAVGLASLAGMGYLTWSLPDADYDQWAAELHRPIPANAVVFGGPDLRFAFDDVTLRGYTSYFYESAPPGSYVVIGRDLLESTPGDAPSPAKIIAERGTLISEVVDPVYGRNLPSPKQDTYTTLIYRLR